LRSGKELALAKRATEERDLKLYHENLVREKKKNANDKEKLIEAMEREKAAKYGKEYVPRTERERSNKEVWGELWEKMRKVYLGKTDQLRTCFKTLLVYLGKKFF
jgi:hypothetical protein